MTAAAPLCPVVMDALLRHADLVICLVPNREPMYVRNKPAETGETAEEKRSVD